MPTGPNTVTIMPGQSTTLTAQPTVSGTPGGTLPGPVAWSNNANLINITTSMSPSGTTCVLSIPAGQVNTGSFTVTATSGNLTANLIVFVVPPPADGMIITATTPQ